MAAASADIIGDKRILRHKLQPLSPELMAAPFVCQLLNVRAIPRKLNRYEE